MTGLLGSKLMTGLLGNAQGPYAPMGAGLNIGAPLDMSRKKIGNADDSFSTELTATIPFNGKWYNVPTIVDGQQIADEDTLINLFSQGLIPHVGEFPTVETAVRSARVRSDYIGRVRK